MTNNIYQKIPSSGNHFVLNSNLQLQNLKLLESLAEEYLPPNFPQNLKLAFIKYEAIYLVSHLLLMP